MTDMVLRNVRLGYGPKLWTPDHFQADPTTGLRFDAQLLVEVESDTHDEIKAEIERVALECWGAKAQNILKMCRADKQKYCYQDGDAKTDKDGEPIESLAGYFILGAHRAAKKGPPIVCDMAQRPLTIADGRPKDGSYVNAKVEIWPQPKGTGSPGIRCSFSVIQFVAHGDSFGGGGIASLEGMDKIEIDENSAEGLV